MPFGPESFFGAGDGGPEFQARSSFSESQHDELAPKRTRTSMRSLIGPSEHLNVEQDVNYEGRMARLNYMYAAADHVERMRDYERNPAQLDQQVYPMAQPPEAPTEQIHYSMDADRDPSTMIKGPWINQTEKSDDDIKAA